MLPKTTPMQQKTLITSDTVNRQQFSLSKQNHSLSLSKKTSFSNSVLIKGELSAKEDIYINGRAQGNIALKNNTLEIGPSGVVKANVAAKCVIVHGEAHGDIYATEIVILKKSAKFFGNIYAPDINIEDGALLKGTIDMKKQNLTKQTSSLVFQDIYVSKIEILIAAFKKILEKTLIRQPNSSMNKFMAKYAIPTAENSNPSPANEPVVNNNNENIYPIHNRSAIGATVKIKGDLLATEDLIINGTVEGMICLKENILELSASANVIGKVFAKVFIANGTINGDAYGSEQIIVKNNGRIYGKLYSSRISIDSGAVVEGGVEMEASTIKKVFSTIKSPEMSNEFMEKSPAMEKNPTIENNPAKEIKSNVNSNFQSDLEITPNPTQTILEKYRKVAVG